MNRYRVTYSNGAIVDVDAYSSKDALIFAEAQAEQDGFPGLRAVSAELVQP